VCVCERARAHEKERICVFVYVCQCARESVCVCACAIGCCRVCSGWGRGAGACVCVCVPACFCAYVRVCEGEFVCARIYVCLRMCLGCRIECKLYTWRYAMAVQQFLYIFAPNFLHFICSYIYTLTHTHQFVGEDFDPTRGVAVDQFLYSNPSFWCKYLPACPGV